MQQACCNLAAFLLVFLMYGWLANSCVPIWIFFSGNEQSGAEGRNLEALMCDVLYIYHANGSLLDTTSCVYYRVMHACVHDIV